MNTIKKLIVVISSFAIFSAVPANAVPISDSVVKDVARNHAVPTTANAGYLWMHFNASDYEKIYYGYSVDGLNWEKLNNNRPIVASDVGTKGLRDPHLLKLHAPDAEGNKYVMLSTDLHAEGTASGGSWDQINASKDLVISKSKDLVKWSSPKLVSTGLEGKVGNAWAPEAIWDSQTNDYLVYWSSRDLSTGKTNETTFLKVFKAHTSDFESFRDPTVWINQSAVKENIIDTTVVKGDDNDYYRFSTSDWYTVVDTSPTLEGKWTRLIERDQAVSNGKSLVTGDTVKCVTSESGLYGTNGNEGLTVYQEPNGKWLAMADHSGYSAFQIDKLSELKNGAKFVAADSTFSQAFRHGTVIRMTNTEQEAVLAAYENSPAGPVVPDVPGSGPIASYDFEDDSDLGKDVSGHGNEMVLHDVGEHGKPGDWGSKVIQLRGGSGEYAELPQGLFDGRNEMTVEFASKSRESGGNFFSFAVGQDQNRYLFVRLRGGSAYVAITDGSYSAEQKIAADVDTQGWHRYVLSVKANHIAFYVDGELAGQVDTTVSVCDLGRNLHAYFGKSFYAGDGYYNGGIDDVRVYNYAKSDLEIRGPEAAVSVKDSDQVLSQDASTDDAGGVTKSIVLDYWADPAKGTKSDKRNVRFEYQIADGVTVSDRNGRKVTVGDLDALSDYSKPLDLRVSYDGRTVDFRIGVEVLVTPVRIPGQVAAAEGVGEKDPTGQEGWKFFADPQAVAYGGKYYIFPTTDGYSGWQGHSIHVFESSDMVNWRDRGVVVDLSKDYDRMPDGRKEKAWAPGFAARDGKFYLYFSGNGQVNVAVSDTSKGGTITSGYEIQKTKVASSIDPAVFHDPQTGKWWLSWGQGPGKYAELNNDMLGVKDSTQVTTNGTKNMREGSYITARRYNGKWTYYYSYSVDDTSSPNYHIEYATAPSMEGDGTQWTWRGTMLSQDASKGILGTGHHAIMQVPGTDDWYVVYHAFLTDAMRPRGYDSTHGGTQLANGNKRELRIARMTYTEPTQKETDAGDVPLIRTVPVTYEGVLPETTPRPEAVVSSSSEAARSAAAGGALVGDVLTAGFNEGWTVHSVQWYRDGSPIAGADRARYVLGAADVGHRITARVVGESTTGVLRNAQPGETGAVASTTDTLATGGFTVSAVPVSPDSPGADGHGADVDRRTPARSGALSRSGAVVSVVGVLGILALLTGLALAIRHRS